MEEAHMTRDEFVKKFKVGDKIRMAHWTCSRFSEILYIGNVRFFARSEDSNEYSFEYEYSNDYFWLPYTEPKKTVKMAQALYQRTDDGTFFINGDFFKSKEEAKEYYTSSSYKIVQWPLVINGVEQWVEVEE
jgi:hypothetical protein